MYVLDSLIYIVCLGLVGVSHTHCVHVERKLRDYYFAISYTLYMYFHFYIHVV